MTFPHDDNGDDRTDGESEDEKIDAIIQPVASTCAACGRALTDPLSIAIGMGPDCRARHGYESAIDGCAAEAREEINGIIHDIACSSERAVSYVAKRMACARLRTLGFTGLAARIEQRFAGRFRRLDVAKMIEDQRATVSDASSLPPIQTPIQPQSPTPPPTTTPRPPDIRGTPAEKHITGTVVRYFFKSATFAAGKLRRAFVGGGSKPAAADDFSDLDGSNMVTFAGPVFADLDTQIILHGAWGEDPKYGQQFKVSNFEIDQSLDEHGLARYLANNPAMRGIGPVRARAIARTFGATFTDTLREHPEQIADAAGMPLENVLAMRAEWDRTALTNTTATKLAAYELTHHQIEALIEAFGNGAATILEQNPYLMLGHVDGMGFARVDEIARKAHVAKTHPGRIEAGIVYTVEHAASLQGDGSTWVEWRDLVARATAMLTLDEMNARELVDSTLTRIVRESEDPRTTARQRRLVCVPIDNRLLVAVPWLYEAEMAVAEKLRAGKQRNPHADVLPEVDATHCATTGMSTGQIAALTLAHDHSISLITGGAGTGKTWTVRRIVEMYEAARLHVALCAPTGKAAKRIEQLVGREAKTMHRLLGYQGGGDRGEQNDAGTGPRSAWPNITLDFDVVIVDETSMVSTNLAWRLLKAVDLHRTAVVFVGDHNQLPPVEAGNPLRDIIERRAVPTTILDVVHRQAGVLKANSTAIIDGRVEKSAPVESERPQSEGQPAVPITPPRSPWILAERNGTPEELAAYVVWLLENHITERLGFDLLRDVQLLTPTHKGPLGDTALNITLQRVLQKKLWSFTVPPPRGTRAFDFHAHDRVIHVKNNYNLGVMNGEVGTVVRTDEYTGEVTVDYPDLKGGGGSGAGASASADYAVYTNKLCPECEGKGFIRDRDAHGFDEGRRECFKCGGVPRGPLNQLQLAYALTIHKYQGSEIACALIICSKAHAFQHHRNLLYTAVTRARETAIIVGDPWGIRNCATKTKLDERNTWLRVVDL